MLSANKKTRKMGKGLALASLGVVALSLGACATPDDTPALAQARQSYAGAAANPQLASNATLELRRAEEALQRGERARSDGNTAEMDHQAYLANRQLQIAQDVAAMKGAQQVVANAETYRLQDQIRALQAERTERGLVMSLGDVLFATGSARLTPGADARLSELANFLQRNPERTVRIEGYTDTTGSSATNLRLSEERAMAVRDALTARGVNPSRIAAQGLGSAQPVASNSTESGRQQNRRVDIVISEPGSVAETRS
ncbi:DUF4398 domain-containing protein [Azospirillum argentinense]|uniref:DUF4398 domain-containing protein n=1 Tax=Azospirillum argentinense TaxID=2970906 RepID=A0A4D8PH63_9PROT|nr:OmpA family protein [Azospirillum argentinense]QCN95717.1 DUF4398 domain-containing protein [Azospirillum argentinense]